MGQGHPSTVIAIFIIYVGWSIMPFTEQICFLVKAHIIFDAFQS